jgi:hypothetical protein
MTLCLQGGGYSHDEEPKTNMPQRATCLHCNLSVSHFPYLSELMTIMYQGHQIEIYPDPPTPGMNVYVRIDGREVEELFR